MLSANREHWRLLSRNVQHSTIRVSVWTSFVLYLCVHDDKHSGTIVASWCVLSSNMFTKLFLQIYRYACLVRVMSWRCNLITLHSAQGEGVPRIVWRSAFKPHLRDHAFFVLRFPWQCTSSAHQSLCPDIFAFFFQHLEIYNPSSWCFTVARNAFISCRHRYVLISSVKVQSRSLCLRGFPLALVRIMLPSIRNYFTQTPHRSAKSVLCPALFIFFTTSPKIRCWQ